jgi:hypothetical protein
MGSALPWVEGRRRQHERRLVNRGRIATIAPIPPEQGQDIAWTTDT